MAGVNRVILVGNLGADAEIKATNGGTSVANLNLAVTEVWKDRGGEQKQKTEWVRIVLFGGQADSLAPYLTKGKQIYVEGRLASRSYEKNEVTHYVTEVKADRIQLLGGGPRERDEQDQRRPQRSAPASSLDDDMTF